MSDVGSESLKITTATIALAAVLAAGFIFGGRMLLGSPTVPVAASAAADPPIGAQYRDRHVAIPSAETSPPPFGPPALPSFPGEGEADAAPHSESVDQPADPADEVGDPPSSPLTELTPISAPRASARPVPSGSARGTQRVAAGDVHDVPTSAGTGAVARDVAALGTGAGRPVTLPTSARSAPERRDTAPGAPRAVTKASKEIGAEDVMGVPSQQRDALQRLFAQKYDAAARARHREQAGDGSPHSWDTAEAEAAATTTGLRDRAKSSTKAGTLSGWRHASPWWRPSASNHRAEAEAPGATPAPPGTASTDVPQRAEPSSATAVKNGAGRQPEAGSARKDTQQPPKQRQEERREKEKGKDPTRPEPAQAAAKGKDGPDPHSDKVTKRPPKKASAPKEAASSLRRQKPREDAPAARPAQAQRKSNKHAVAAGKSGAKDKAVRQPPRPPKADKGEGRGKKGKRP